MPVKPLTESDTKHLLAAEGWLELGNFLAANDELHNITPLFRTHPDVLEVRYKVFAAGGKWEGCLIIAETLTTNFPKRISGWVGLASAMHHMGHTESAYEALVEVGDEFAEHPDVTYALAVYAALTGQMKEAKDWLERAMNAGDPKWKLKALRDPALTEFWRWLNNK